jgi:hypothetical protein
VAVYSFAPQLFNPPSVKEEEEEWLHSRLSMKGNDGGSFAEVSSPKDLLLVVIPMLGGRGKSKYLNRRMGKKYGVGR